MKATKVQLLRLTHETQQQAELPRGANRKMDESEYSKMTWAECKTKDLKRRGGTEERFTMSHRNAFRTSVLAWSMKFALFPC